MYCMSGHFVLFLEKLWFKENYKELKKLEQNTAVTSLGLNKTKTP